MVKVRVQDMVYHMETGSDNKGANLAYPQMKVHMITKISM